jgi:hypothetical protein
VQTGHPKPGFSSNANIDPLMVHVIFDRTAVKTRPSPISNTTIAVPAVAVHSAYMQMCAP